METRKYDLMKEASLRLEAAQKAMQALAEAESDEEWKKKYEAKLFMLHEMQKDLDKVTYAAADTWKRVAYKILFHIKKEDLLSIIKTSCGEKIYKLSELNQLFKDYPEDTVHIIKSIQKVVDWDYYKWFCWHPEEKVLEYHRYLKNFIMTNLGQYKLNDPIAIIGQKRLETILNDDTLSKMLGYKERSLERYRKTVDWEHKMK